MVKCVWENCPDEANWDGLCEYHTLLVNYWFYELGGHKYTPAELSFTLTGDPAPASYPETADPDAATYRARYQKWANDLGEAECDQIVFRQGGKPKTELARDARA